MKDTFILILTYPVDQNIYSFFVNQDPAKREFAKELIAYTNKWTSIVFGSFKGDPVKEAGKNCCSLYPRFIVHRTLLYLNSGVQLFYWSTLSSYSICCVWI